MTATLWVCLLILQPISLMIEAQEGQKMTFTMPKMSEEEQHSMHLPSNMLCDACTAVAYQMKSQLEKAESKKNGRKLKESEYIDLFDDICYGKSFDEYGVKAVNGVNRISGDGLEAKDVPGMLQGGGKWPGRLAEKCGILVGEIGEDEVYEEFHKKRDLFEMFCKVSTKDCVKKSKEEL